MESDIVGVLAYLHFVFAQDTKKLVIVEKAQGRRAIGPGGEAQRSAPCAGKESQKSEAPRLHQGHLEGRVESIAVRQTLHTRE